MRELLHVTLQFFINPGHSLRAVLYDRGSGRLHIDLVPRYQDGTAITFANIPPTGINQHPNFPNVFVGHVSLADLLERCLKERPSKPMETPLPANAVAAFEEATAKGLAWRKQRAATSEEVQRIVE